MGWISETSEAIRAHTRSEPIECPRGWGQVAFVSSVWAVPPLFGVDRKCPIAGVGDCGDCGYASNPDALRLAEQIAALDGLLDAGSLSPEEHERRRRAVVHLHDGAEAGRRWQRTTAWLLAPLGALATLAGVVLALEIHAGFWGLAGGGAACLVLGLSFWGMSRGGRDDRG